MITCTYQKEFGFDSNIKLIYNGLLQYQQQIILIYNSGKINILICWSICSSEGNTSSYKYNKESR